MNQYPYLFYSFALFSVPVLEKSGGSPDIGEIFFNKHALQTSFIQACLSLEVEQPYPAPQPAIQ